MNKRGSEKYYIIMSLILGIIVLGLSLFYIFNEYFTEEDLDLEACRQSVVLRNAMPEFSIGGFNFASAKKSPLKCKTQVMNIDYPEVEKAEEQIVEAVVSSWYILGDGEFTIFPTNGIFEDVASSCMVLLRVHLDESVKKDYSGDNKINLEEAFSKKFDSETTYWDYLTKGDVNPFVFFAGWHEGGFWFEKKDSWQPRGIDYDGQKSFYFPKYFYPDKGDLFVVYSEPVRLKVLSSERAVPPFMILLQEDELGKLGEVWLEYELDYYPLKICSSYETIPA